MIGNFYRAYTGLEVNAKGLEVTGNNLSNINTVGYKRGMADFAQLMSSVAAGTTGTGAPVQFGLGANVASVGTIFNQGSIQSTGIQTNMALSGPGFFVLGNNGDQAYTRAGNFTLDASGQLVSGNSGGVVQGYTTLDAGGNIDPNGAIGDIVIDLEQTAPARATSMVRFTGNLSASAAPGAQYAQSLDLYDSNGVKRTLELVYTKETTPGAWTYSFSLDGASPPVNGTGTLQFGSAGMLETIDGTLITDYQNQEVTIPGLPNGADDLALTWDLVGADGAANLTNYGAESSTSDLYQNGVASGSLEGIAVNPDGTILGQFSNGERLALAQVALARFPNNAGLRQAGGGLFLQTGASGEVQVGAPGDTGVLAGNLETSNVDIADEFTSLIIHQRGYQSNAKTVTTSDQMLQEVINLKR